MSVALVASSVGLNFFHFLQAVCERVFVHGVGLASHRALIGGDFVAFEHDGVGRNLHALADDHHVPDQKVILVQLHWLQ